MSETVICLCRSEGGSTEMGDVTPGYTLQVKGADVACQLKVFLVDGVAPAGAAAACHQTRSPLTDPLLEGILTGQTSEHSGS